MWHLCVRQCEKVKNIARLVHRSLKGEDRGIVLEMFAIIIKGFASNSDLSLMTYKGLVEREELQRRGWSKVFIVNKVWVFVTHLLLTSHSS